MGIILIGGIKHCGKTSLGRILAESWNYQFHDLDQLIISCANNAWESVREIWTNLGKEEFMRLEAEAARTFSEWIVPSASHHNCVLSLGGAAIENPKAMGWLHDLGTKVYIRADFETLYRRIMKKGRPPFLSEDNSREDFQEIYERRNALYEDYADVIHDVDDSPVQINAERLMATLEKHNVR